MGAAFGGSSQTLFGGGGPAGFMAKLTTTAAVAFMLTSLGLAYVSAHSTGSVQLPVSQQQPAQFPAQTAPEAIPEASPETSPEATEAPGGGAAPQAAGEETGTQAQ